MSHDIATINGAVAMSYIGQSPWWESSDFAGKLMTDEIATNVEKAAEAANLNWHVETQPTYLADGRLNPFHQAVVRDIDNAILGSVGAHTKLVQNEDALSIVQPLVDEFGARIETAGALGNGARVWMLVKMPQRLEPVSGDIVDGYGLLRHAHDNSYALEFIPTLIRVVCRNTMQVAVAAAGGNQTDQGRIFRIKKTRNVSDRVKEARTLVHRLGEIMQRSEQTFAKMAQTRVNPEQIAHLIEEVFPYYKDATGKEVFSKTMDARRKEVAKEIFTSPGAELAGSNLNTGETTAWAVLNAVAHYLDHTRPEEAKSLAARKKAQISALFGVNAATKLLAMSKVSQLVAAA